MEKEELIRDIATKACCEVLRERTQSLAEDTARRIGVALAAEVQQSQPVRTKELRDGVVLIAGSKTQTETLEALLAAGSAVTPACGLLVLRGTQASGWNCQQLTSVDNFKRATMDCSRGAAATVINSAAAISVSVSELDPVFVARLGLENSATAVLVPVLLKERVAALLLALSHWDDDLAGLELLVQVAQVTLDLHAYRKASPQPATGVHQATQAPKEPHRVPHPEATTYDSPRPAAPPVTTAGHESDSAYSVAARRAFVPSIPTVQIASQPSGESVTTLQVAQASPDEAHEKARRFAKLLVEEIKLYNQTKVAEGRARGDLYGRLRDDIEKSRAAYQKRYGESVRDVDYFTQELMRILADNNQAVMGAGFPS